MSTNALTSSYSEILIPQPQPPTGPACDECRQRKVKCDRLSPACGNCARNGFLCEYSNKGKRVNHTRQLVDDVAGLNDRLDSIDDATQQLMERVDAITTLLRRSGFGDHPHPRKLGHEEKDDTTQVLSDGHLRHKIVELPDTITAEAPNLVQSDTGLERFYGSFSTHALFYTARKIIERLITQIQSNLPNPVSSKANQSPSASIIRLSRALDHTALPQIIQSFNNWTSQPYDEDDLEIQAQPVALPPIRLLEESLRYFFDDSCWEWPIFRKETVLEAIRAQYSPQQPAPDIAWRLCLNNIILLSLSSKSEMTGNNTTLITLTDNGILRSLINNAKLAINLTPYLMSPRLVNVQALLSLALVARDFIHYSIFERALSYAYQVASAMGLQEEYGNEMTRQPQDSERRNVLWAIYALDKQRCFLRGTPCLIYQFECSITFPTHSDSIFREYWVAQIQLTCVMEKIYRELYSPRSKTQTNQHLEENLSKCDKLLKSWSSQHGALLDVGSDKWSAQTLFAQQLRYSHYACRILVHRRGSCSQNHHVCIESAREALKIVQTLAHGSGNGRQALIALRRIFNSCSMMAYYELWVHVLHSPSRGFTGDVALLVDFAKALESLTNPIYPQAYCARVSRAIRWCTHLIQLIQDVKLPNGAFTPSVSHPSDSPRAQLGAWELLAPAFFSTSPYGYDFVGGNNIEWRGQSPANAGMRPQAADAIRMQQSQQVWPHQPVGMTNLNQAETLNSPNVNHPFIQATVPPQTDMPTTLSADEEMTGNQYYK